MICGLYLSVLVSWLMLVFVVLYILEIVLINEILVVRKVLVDILINFVVCRLVIRNGMFVVSSGVYSLWMVILVCVELFCILRMIWLGLRVLCIVKFLCRNFGF